MTEWCGSFDTSHDRKLAKLPIYAHLTTARRPASQSTSTTPRALLRESAADRDFAAVAICHCRNAQRGFRRHSIPTRWRVGAGSLSVYDYIERRIPGGHRSPLGAPSTSPRHRVRRGSAPVALSDLPLAFSLPQRCRSLASLTVLFRGGDQRLRASPATLAAMQYDSGTWRKSLKPPAAVQGHFQAGWRR